MGNAADLLRAVRNGPPKCVVCDAEVLGAKRLQNADREQLWCEACKSFQNTYRGPQRAPLCGSCFNNVDGKCAAMKYQMPDGTWRDRYNQAHTSEYRQMGMDRVTKPIEPTRMTKPQYDCECYEFLGENQTRETIRINDPLRFYDKSRFWD